ncbi:MAG: hypothetical protein SNJ63_02160 [Sphingomonadaceae bacterium]
MAKWVSPAVLDAALTVLASGTRLVALASQPTTYAQALSQRLVEATVGPDDFSIAPGDQSGRKVAIAAKSGLQAIAAGVANHIALLNTNTEQLLYVTTCPAQAVAAGGNVSISGWTVEIADPA